MRQNKEKRAVKTPGLRYWPLRTYGRLSRKSMYDLPAAGSAFTVMEILVVVVIIAIAAMIAVPMITSAGSVQIRSAANVIAADLEYTKSMAISRQKTYAVVFDESTESYHIEDANGTIEHPVKKGFTYEVNFSNDSRLSKVDIVNVDFNATPQVSFDYFGSPDSGGIISLQADGATATIRVESVTGFISITD